MPDHEELPMAESIDEAELQQSHVRDRIVLLGRRAAGKTIYLSVLYEKYWKSLNGFCMKALRGDVHSHCIKTVEELRNGRWPAATLETRHCDLEIDYNGQKHLLVALDYAGELFRKAFIEDDTDSPDTSELLQHIDSALAVILLIDPDLDQTSDIDSTIDDDFGMTQAVERIRNWPGGDEVPIVVAFTKADVNIEAAKQLGGPDQILKKRFPALARTLQKVALFHVSSVQSITFSSGKTEPKKDFVPWQVEKPLIYCLDALKKKEDEKLELERLQQERQAARNRDYVMKQHHLREQRNVSLIIVGGLLFLALVACLCWVAYR